MTIDHEGPVGALARPLAATTVETVLLDAVAERYERRCEDCSLLSFTRPGRPGAQPEEAVGVGVGDEGQLVEGERPTLRKTPGPAEAARKPRPVWW
jgi:hypothetical protein